VKTVAHERPPSLVAACLASAGGLVLASFLVGLVMAPLALVTWTAVAFSGDPSTARVLLPWLLLLAIQPFVSAWIAQQGLDLFDAGRVTYARASAAMLLAFVVSAVSALALPGGAALPVLGYAWAGALAAGVVIAGQR
jgi:hypothetical protein